MPLPNPDVLTHERLLCKASDAPAIMAAVVAYLVGSLGRDEAARILREWADEVQRFGNLTPGEGHH